jgi:hypothetical protein
VVTHHVDGLEWHPDHPVGEIRFTTISSAVSSFPSHPSRRTSWSSTSATRTTPPKPLLSAFVLVTSPSLPLCSWPTHALDLLLDIIHALPLQHPRKGEESTQDDRSGDELVHRSPGDGGRGLVTEVDPVEDREPEASYEGCEAAGCGIGKVSA